MMAGFMSYFGGRRDPKQSSREAIVTLRQQLQMIEKKEDYLQKKIEEEVKKAKANAVSNKTGSFGWIYPCYLSRTLVPPTPLVRPIMITITDLSLSSVWFLPLIGIWVYMGVTFTRNSGYASSQTEESIRIGFR